MQSKLLPCMSSNLKLFTQGPNPVKVNWQQPKVNCDTETWVGTCVEGYRHHSSLPAKLWGRDILKHDYRRMYWHKYKLRSRGHTAAEALFQGELCAVHTHTHTNTHKHIHTHTVINVQITSYYSCPHAQTRLSLVNYSQTRRDLAADWYAARVAESVTL